MAMNIQAEQLRALPARPTVTWQGGAVTLPAKVRGDDGSDYTPALFLWVDTTTGMVRPSMPGGSRVTPDVVVQSFLDFANAGGQGGYRPGRLEVSDAAFAAALTDLVSPLGITVAVLPRLQAVDAMAAELMGSMGLGGDVAPPDALADDPAITPDRLGRFAAAAAGFHAAAPWKLFGPTDLVRVVKPKVAKPFRFFNVMGGGGEQFGLAFFPSVAAFRQMSEGDPGEYAAKHAMVSVTFDTDEMIPPGDVALWKQHDWPTGKRGRKVVYPFPVTFNRGVWIRPTVAELAVMEGLLRAVTAVDEAGVIAGKWTATVPAADGPAEFAFDVSTQAMPSLSAMSPMSPFGGLADPPATEAERLIEASLSAGGVRAADLARRAVAADPDAVDAYVRLGDLAPSPAEGIEFYKQGLAAGERALGARYFKTHMGEFWGLLETRPYMRALAGLAQAYRTSGQLDEAIRTWQRMLELNPNDNQGMRDVLAAVLMEQGRDADATALMAKYPDEASAVHTYTEALLAFRKGGDSPDAVEKLRLALECNPHLVTFLTGHRTVPKHIPEMYSHGEETEALTFAGDLLPGWRDTPGAVDWLLKHVDVRRAPKAKGAKRAGKKKK